jgi:hypothetical protein
MLILSHIGQNKPDYLEPFLKQLRIFNPNEKIVFLVNTINLNDSLFKYFSIDTYPIEDLHTNFIDLFINKFGLGDINSHKKNIIYGSPDYWCVAATRLFYVYEYAKKFNIKNYFHFENDIMIYESLQYIEKTIVENNLFKNEIAITRGTNNKIMTGFMYVNNNNFIMTHLLNEFSNYLNDKDSLFSYGIDMINEMSLLHIYQIKNQDLMKNLPILPFENENIFLSENFEYFNSIFDPATYGQFLDGIPSNQGVSIKTDSYIGDLMRVDDTINVTFEIIDNLKIPFLSIKNKKIKINNLHIHSKRLDLFLS